MCPGQDVEYNRIDITSESSVGTNELSYRGLYQGEEYIQASMTLTVIYQKLLRMDNNIRTQ